MGDMWAEFYKLLLTVTNGYDILCLTINVKLFIINIKKMAHGMQSVVGNINIHMVCFMVVQHQ